MDLVTDLTPFQFLFFGMFAGYCFALLMHLMFWKTGSWYRAWLQRS